MDAKHKQTRKWQHAHHNAEVVSVLEQVSKYPDDPESAVDYLLSRLSGHPGASQMFTDRQLRKLANTLKHHAEKYKAMIAAVYEKFDSEIAATCPRAADVAPVYLDGYDPADQPQISDSSY